MQLQTVGTLAISSTLIKVRPILRDLRSEPDVLLEAGSRLGTPETLVFTCEGLVYRATRSPAGCDRAAHWVIRFTESGVRHDYLASRVELLRSMHAMDQTTDRTAFIQRLSSRTHEAPKNSRPFVKASTRDYRGGNSVDWKASTTKSVLEIEATQAARRLNTVLGRAPLHVDPLITGSYDGPVLWTNEGHLLQRTAAATVIHELSALTICRYCRLRPKRTVRVSYNDGRGYVCSSDRHDEKSAQAASRFVVVSSQGTTDVSDSTFTALRHRGFADHATELAVRLISSSVARPAFACLVRRLRTEGQLSLRADPSPSRGDVDALLLAEVVRCRYAAWLGRHDAGLPT